MPIILNVSKQEENHCFDYKLLHDSKRNKSEVVYNGVEKTNLDKHKRNKQKTIFLNVARCVEQKNPQLFLESAVQFVKQNNNAEFVFVGDGPKLAEIRLRIINEGLEDKIKFVGYSNDVKIYLESADFYFSTSLYEGMPYSVIEGMSFGLPLILSDVIGHSELISNNGYLYQINNKDEIYKLLNNMCNLSDNEYVKLSDSSLQYFNEKFNAAKNIKEIQKIYEL